MAIKFVNPAEAVQNKGIKMLVYGPAGVGKTVLCATAGEPTLIVSAEAGLLSIRNAPKTISIIEVKSRAETEGVLMFLEKEKSPPWVCIDSITEIGQWELEYQKTLTSNNLQAYGATGEIMLEMVRRFRDLPNTNVLMTGQMHKNKDEAEGRMIYEIDMPGGTLRSKMPHMFDLVGAMRVIKDKDTGALTHLIQTHQDERYDAKDRSGVLETYENPSLKDIKAKIDNHANKPEKRDGK